MLGGNCFEHIFGRYQRVSDGQGMPDIEIKFVLTCRDLVMAGFDTDMHLSVERSK